KPQTPPETKVNGDSRPLVVIDPGHGGIDNGTRAASGEMEKTIVLEFSSLLRDKIEKTGKYRVLMTRTDDTFVALGDRVQLGRAAPAPSPVARAERGCSSRSTPMRGGAGKATPRGRPFTRSRNGLRMPARPASPRPRTRPT